MDLSGALSFLNLNFPNSFSELSETTFAGWLRKAQRDDKDFVDFFFSYPEINTMVTIRIKTYPELTPQKSEKNYP